MGRTVEIGRRIELCSMDGHCRNMSLGLYCLNVDGVPRFRIHTYNSLPGSQERVQFLTRALSVMAGLERVPDAPDWLQFPCRSIHKRALKRGFLDTCKLESDTAIDAKALSVFDKKSDCRLSAVYLGDGVYRIDAERPTEAAQKRSRALADGFTKVCEMDAVEGHENQVGFPCRSSHDPLIGLLMFRAQNVRSAMREQLLAASRGVLASPSQQKD